MYGVGVDLDQNLTAAFKEHDLAVGGHAGSHAGDNHLKFFPGDLVQVFLAVHVFLF
jgi:hypothetical protein